MGWIVKVGIIGAGLLWGALCLSGYGFLIDQTKVEAPPAHFECTYFTGTGTFRAQFLYSEIGLIGRAACPRWREI